MRQTFIKTLTIGLFFAANCAVAHPGSGIVVDRQGNVYFVDTGSGVWKIDRTGALTRLPGPAYHWMAIDIDDRLENVALPYFSSGDATVTRVGSNPTLLLSSDFPIGVGPDGSLYYPWAHSDDGVDIFRLQPSGRKTTVKNLPSVRSGRGEIRWRNGIVVSAEGSIYYTEDRTIRRITPEGELISVISNPELSGCGPMAGVEPELGPYFRGVAVDAAGNVYVAATGCRTVFRIAPDNTITAVLQASSPWSPTSVAVWGEELYVLEYLHTPGDNRREWLPRVRKLSPDGTVATIATIER